MMARTLINTPATRAKLGQAVANAAPHLRRIVQAVRDHGVDMMLLAKLPELSGSG